VNLDLEFYSDSRSSLSSNTDRRNSRLDAAYTGTRLSVDGAPTDKKMVAEKLETAIAGLLAQASGVNDAASAAQMQFAKERCLSL
jgi:hypothetical protein